jgi:hypothetical protein
MPTATENHRPAGTVTSAAPRMANLGGRSDGQTYEWFLKLPVRLVIAVMWFAGAAIIGVGGLALYLFGLLLWRVAGA